jgi:hypothetical protein
MHTLTIGRLFNWFGGDPYLQPLSVPWVTAPTRLRKRFTGEIRRRTEYGAATHSATKLLRSSLDTVTRTSRHGRSINTGPGTSRCVHWSENISGFRGNLSDFGETPERPQTYLTHYTVNQRPTNVDWQQKYNKINKGANLT